jgi:hypothetical protein
MLEEQYNNVQKEHPEVWQALLRRIKSVWIFSADGSRQEYTIQDYLYRSIKFTELPQDTATPFETITKCEQEELPL